MSLHPAHHAKTTPGKPALILEPSGEHVTYAALDQASNRYAQFLRRHGVQTGEAVGIMLENNAAFLAAAWGAQRAGVHFACISTKLTAGELGYIVGDSGAKLLFTQSRLHAADGLADLGVSSVLVNVDGARSGFIDFAAEASSLATTPIADQAAGRDLLYSSGTTGRPKGIRHAINPALPFDAPDSLANFLMDTYGFGGETVYLCPAPLYHAAPLRWSMAVQRIGGTAVVMERFDAQEALRLIETHRIDRAQFVPTHFVRMLKLPQSARERYDLSSLRLVVHAAAPCPIEVKHAMIDWLGPIIEEYYSGSEGFGITLINSREWLAHRGSVGKPVGCEIRICDEAGEPLAAGRTGQVYFVNEQAADFSYHNDPAQTACVRNRHGWMTLGDVGHVDGEGYLYLTDRGSFMIISGGVNIYPQEIENVLIQHEAVFDVAVIGVPDEEMGEQVIAVVQPAPRALAGAVLAAELTDYVRARLSHVKCPRRIDFVAELPRHDTGKLYKRMIQDDYRRRKLEEVVESAGGDVPSPPDPPSII